MSSDARRIHSVGVVGGGTTGTSVFCQLVNKLIAESGDGSSGKSCSDFEVHWWEAGDRFGPGLAWGEQSSDVQIFNLPAGVAGVLPGDYGAFLAWCGAHGIKADFGSYPPRNTFGPFVEHTGQTAVRRAVEHGIAVHLHPSSAVTSLREEKSCKLAPAPGPARMRVRWEEQAGAGAEGRAEAGAGGREAELDAVVLCTGE
jgi:uncharacterized NAD(P)/FAD-binding protein YdhS